MNLSTQIQLGQGTAYAKEMAKHEAHHSQYGPPGRPFEQRDYPALMYRATQKPQGGEPNFEHLRAEDDRDRERLERQGYVWGGPAAALAALEQREFELAELAANRHFTDRKMSDKAQAEAERVDSSTTQHLGAIPETPLPAKNLKVR